MNHTRCVMLMWTALLPWPTTALAKVTVGRFVVAADLKTVYDTRTKLTWQRAVATSGGVSNNGSYNWAAAKTYCKTNAAALPGSGWRMPNLVEVLSLMDLKTKSGPALDTVSFPNTPNDFFWTSTPVGGSAVFSWQVYMNDATYGSGDVTAGKLVRCVH